MPALQQAQQHAFKRFHRLEYSKQLKKAGLHLEVVDIQADAMEALKEDIMHHSGFATENNLENLRKEMDHRFEKTDQKIEDLRKEMDHRFEKTDQKIEDLRKDMDHRFERVDHRFEQTDQKIEGLRKDMNTQFIHLKKDVALQITKSMNRCIIWVFGFSFSLSGSLLAVMAKGFHWI